MRRLLLPLVGIALAAAFLVTMVVCWRMLGMLADEEEASDGGIGVIGTTRRQPLALRRDDERTM